MFKDNLAQLPGVAHLRAIEVIYPDERIERIENQPGSSGSVAVYHYLQQEFSGLTAEAARRGLEIYAEHTADAEAFPGKHPNIDRLLAIAGGQSPGLSLRLISA